MEHCKQPFLKNVYPSDHKFMQNNDLKHTSGYAEQWMKDNRINWWMAPAESPDLNPIENLWHERKEYVCCEVNLKMKDELVAGIKFLSTVDK